MTRTSIQAGFDTWAGSVKPSMSHGDEKGLHVANGVKYAYLHTAKPAPAGATVLSSTLYIYAKGASSGSRNLTVRAITEEWKARTLNWNNAPTTTPTGAVVTTVGALADKDPVTFDVTAIVQSMVLGTVKNYGFRLTSNGSDHTFYSVQSGLRTAKLVTIYSEAPGTPTGLTPGGGLVGVPKPTLQWDYGGMESLGSYQVQADPAANEVTPAYDSGVTAASSPIHPLAGTTFNQLAIDGSSTFWRVQVTDVAGHPSDWSDWVSVTRDDKGTLTINSPGASPNNYVTEPTPPILFSLAGETLKSFRVYLTPARDRNNVLHDSGKIAATTGAYTLPLRPKTKKPYLVTGKTYSVGVRVHDAKRRQGSAATGDTPYVEVWRDFTVIDTDSVTAPVLTSVAQFGVTPAATLTFTRGTAPDEFVVLRDGEEIAAQLLPGDLFVSGTTYAYHDWSAHPGVAHSYKVKAVVNGVQSHASNTVALTGGTSVVDLWVIDPDTERYFVLWGSGVDDWKQVEVGADYLPLGARASFRVTQGLGGLSGTFNGELWDQSYKSLDAMVDDLWAMKEDAPHSDGFRLVGDYLNIPVRISNLTCTVQPDSNSYEPRRQASFAFSQIDEFEFEGLV